MYFVLIIITLSVALREQLLGLQMLHVWHNVAKCLYTLAHKLFSKDTFSIAFQSEGNFELRSNRCSNNIRREIYNLIKPTILQRESMPQSLNEFPLRPYTVWMITCGRGLHANLLLHAVQRARHFTLSENSLHGLWLWHTLND